MTSRIMSLFRNMLGGKPEEAAAEAKREPATEYNGYAIYAAPRRQAGGWLTAGTIAKEFPDGLKEHHFIRADTYTDRDDCIAFCIQKAKQIIDEQGDRIFPS